MLFERLSVFCGNAHPTLARAICDHLRIPLGRADVFEFANENIFVRILDHVRQHDVFVVQPTCTPVQRSIMELLIIIDALKRASAGRVTAVIPYYAYGRTDKKDQPRVPITARLVADLITVAGANRVLTMDLHAGQIQGFFNIPVDELTALYTLSRYFMDKRMANPVVVAADEGIVKRARNFADRLAVPLAVVEKRRTGDKVQVMNVIGDVSGMQAIIVDDEVDTGGSLTNGACALLQAGATEVYAAITHGVLSGPSIERLAAGPLKELVITDTIPLPDEKRLPHITVLSVAPLIAETIHAIHIGAPVGELYDRYK